MPGVWPDGPSPVREPTEALHDIPSEEDGSLVGFVQDALLVEPLEYPNVRRVQHGRMGVPEDGDEFVRVDLGFDRGERGVAALVCEGGAHWHYVEWPHKVEVDGVEEGWTGREEKEEKRRNASVRKGGREDGTRNSPCTRQTSLCTWASANFLVEFIVMDDDDDVEVVGERGACTTVAMELDI